MDSLPRLLRLPCHPSRPPALPPAHGLPSRGLAGGGSDGVRQSPRLPDGEPPPAGRPKWREGRQLPRPRLLFVWRGGGEPRLAPGAAGLCQSLPRLGLPGPRTLRTLSAMLGDAALTPSLVFSLASCSPALWLSLCLQEAVGLSETRGPCQISRATDTPPLNTAREVTGTELGSPATSVRLWESQARSCHAALQPKLSNSSSLLPLP